MSDGNKINKLLTPDEGAAPAEPETALVPVREVVTAEVLKSNNSVTTVATAAPAKRQGRPPKDLAYVTREEAAGAAEAMPAGFWRELVRFLWLSGARISEALAVTPADVDVRTNVVHLTTLKRRGRRKGQRRAVPIPQPAVAALLYVASICGVQPDGRLWAVSRVQAWKRIRKALELAGVDETRRHPHVFRHGHAIHALRHGASLDLVARNLGHASVVTTSHYLRATGQDVQEAYGEIEW